MDLQRVLDLGAHHGALLPELRERPGVDEIVMLDSCGARTPQYLKNTPVPGRAGLQHASPQVLAWSLL